MRKLKVLFGVMILVLGISFLAPSVGHSVIPPVPKKIYLFFSNACLEYRVRDRRLRLIAEGSVLSRCGSWRVLRTEPFIFQMKRRTWERFFWKVNTKKGVVYRVRGREFGESGGRRERLNVVVETVGRPRHPKKFYLKFSDAYMVIRPGHRPGVLKGIKVFAQGNVIARDGNWRIKRLKPFLFHLKKEGWRGYYWKINTSRRAVYRVEGGKFGRYGGRETRLNIRVDVVY